jgi:hypothetical protein
LDGREKGQNAQEKRVPISRGIEVFAVVQSLRLFAAMGILIAEPGGSVAVASVASQLVPP